MEFEEYEWDAAKAASNLAKHGVAFEDARRVFDDAYADHRYAPDTVDDEQRMMATGMVNGVVLTVAYTERGDKTRIISARKATRHEQKAYFDREF
jgi:uncharacterized DUF497 family protein